MQLTIFTANCRGRKSNTLYPNKCIIDSEEDFLKVVEFDHVCGEYKGNRRSVDNFLNSNCLVMDNDNTHSDDPNDWIKPEAYKTMFPDVAFIVVPSRNNMKLKDGKTPRPRHHIYFPIDTVTDKDTYKQLKEMLMAKYPFFDDNALDAARFIYGNPTTEILWHEGEITIDCILSPPQTAKTIPQGQRNNTMSRFAGRILKRYGISERAYSIFIEESNKCNPLLESEELETIWRSACRFAKKVMEQDGYIPPEEYDFQIQSLKPYDYSDIGQAKVIAREYGDELRYTSATDYIRFDGQRWVESKQRAVGAVEEFLDLQLEDAKDAVQNAIQALKSAGVSEETLLSGGKKAVANFNEEQMNLYKDYVSAVSYKAFVMKRRDMKYIVSAMQAAKPMLEMKPTDLDADGMLLNTPDGTYDLRQGLDGRQEHNAADFITKMTAFAPSDDGKKEWLDTLDRIFEKDPELIDYVQQIAGLCAIGNVYLEELIISYGVGSNGKSTFYADNRLQA